jgi:hypothetical protein
MEALRRVKDLKERNAADSGIPTNNLLPTSWVNPQAPHKPWKRPEKNKIPPAPSGENMNAEADDGDDEVGDGEPALGPWTPRKRLPRDSMEHLRFLRASDPERYKVATLAKLFGIR